MMNYRLTFPLESDIKRVLQSEVKELPSFPPVMVKLMQVSRDDKASIQDLSKLVETDPGISAKVLGVVNSALYGLRRKVTSVSEAIVYLGFDEVQKISLGVSVFEKFFKSEKRRKFDRVFFWRHCLCVAILSMLIAREIHYHNPEEAYIGGLLHDFGKIIFDLQGRVNYGDFVGNVAASTGRMISEERKLMGMGHDDLGAYYSVLWHLPRPIVLAVKYHHQQYGHLDLSDGEATLIAIISLANFLSWTQGMGSVDIVRPPILQPEVEKNIDSRKIDFVNILNEMDREMENTSKFYNFVFPSTSQLRENLLQANLRLCKINTVYYYLANQPSKTVDAPRIKESLTIPHRSLDPQEIVTATLKAIHKDFGFDRLYVMKVLKKKRRLKVVEFFDAAGSHADLSSIEIPLDQTAGGFIHCLRNQEAAIINSRTTGGKKTLKKFNINEMVIVPFCSHNKVIGILGMDNMVSKNPLLPDLLTPIAIVASELGMAMENAAAYKEAKAVSLRDGLTGLLNRLAIDELMAKSFRKAVAGENQLSLVMIDVDYFKKFNDKFGHQAGDNILKLIATTLKKLSRPFDQVGRYGGEEFIVILNDTDLSKALVYAERIRKEIEHLGHLLAKRFPGLSLTVSAGVSEYQANVKTVDMLIATADKALYHAKETGRNKVMKG